MLNEEQHYFIRSGFGFSILWILLLFLVSIFEVTREFIPIVLITFAAMWTITLINVWMFKDDRKN